MIKFKLKYDDIDKLKKCSKFSWSQSLIIKPVHQTITFFLCDTNQIFNREKNRFIPKDNNYFEIKTEQNTREDFIVIINKQKSFKPKKYIILPIYFTPIDDYEVTISLKDKTIEFLSERKTMKLTYPIEILDQVPTPDSNNGVKTNA